MTVDHGLALTTTKHVAAAAGATAAADDDEDVADGWSDLVSEQTAADCVFDVPASFPSTP